MVYRNYLFQNISYSLYDILIYLEYIHVYNHTNEIYKINKFISKKYITKFVKRSIQKYMHKCNTKNCCTSGSLVGKGGGTFVLYNMAIKITF